MCLICERVFSNEAMKPFRITEHLKKAHPDKENKDLSFFKSLWDKFEKRPTLSNMFCNASQQNTNGLHASYSISLWIAKSGKPLTIGEELILPAVNEVLRTVLRKLPHDIIKTIPLSNSSVQRWIDELAANVEDTLCSVLRTTDFALHLDESTFSGNESLLLGYVCFAKDEILVQELHTHTHTLKKTQYFVLLNSSSKGRKSHLSTYFLVQPMEIVSMKGCYSGFVAYLKKAVPDVFTIHCFIHHQNLVAKKNKLLLTQLTTDFHHCSE